jgi:hypothetical protein
MKTVFILFVFPLMVNLSKSQSGNEQVVDEHYIQVSNHLSVFYKKIIHLNLNANINSENDYRYIMEITTVRLRIN